MTSCSNSQRVYYRAGTAHPAPIPMGNLMRLSSLLLLKRPRVDGYTARIQDSRFFECDTIPEAGAELSLGKGCFRIHELVGSLPYNVAAAPQSLGRLLCLSRYQRKKVQYHWTAFSGGYLDPRRT